MSGMSEPKVVHLLQVVRVARMFCNIRERLGCSDTKQTPKTLCVYTDTDWAADELTRKSVSCTVERYGSHMIDCSVAKQSLVALSSGRGRVLRHCQGRGDIEANLTDLGTDRDAIGGDHCIRQQCSPRNMHQDGIREGETSFNQRVVDTRIVSQERVPVGVGRHVAELGGHWNESTHV